MDIKVLGIDLGKTVCSLAGLDEAGAVVFRKRLQRHRLLDFLDGLPPCVVAMEACGGAHHIGRFCLQNGHEPRLMSPLYVRPYVKVHKNDDRDAEAIAEAATRPTMSFVAIKSEEQLDLQALHRARERLVSDRTRLINQSRGFLYLVAIMDWHTRKVLAWRISNTLEADFCVEALNEAIHKFGPPEIMNTDQGSQFTSFAWTDRLRRTGVRISMDGKGRFLDNIFIERLWRTLKYECVYLHAWETGSEAKAGLRQWMTFYNHQRPHSALGGRPPAVVYWLRKDETQPDQQVQRVA